MNVPSDTVGKLYKPYDCPRLLARDRFHIIKKQGRNAEQRPVATLRCSKRSEYRMTKVAKAAWTECETTKEGEERGKERGREGRWEEVGGTERKRGGERSIQPAESLLKF